MHIGVVQHYVFSMWNSTLREADTAWKIERSTRSQTGPLIQRTVLCQLFMIHMHEWDDGKLWKNPFNSRQPLHLLDTFMIYHISYIITRDICGKHMWIWYTATCLFLIFIPLHSNPGILLFVALGKPLRHLSLRLHPRPCFCSSFSSTAGGWDHKNRRMDKKKQRRP